MDILLQEIMLSIKAILGVIKSSTGQRRHGIVADSVYFSWKLLETSRIIWIHLKILDKKNYKKSLPSRVMDFQNISPKVYISKIMIIFFILLRFIWILLQQNHLQNSEFLGDLLQRIPGSEAEFKPQISSPGYSPGTSGQSQLALHFPGKIFYGLNSTSALWEACEKGQWGERG